jgi:hypothetical protein
MTVDALVCEKCSMVTGEDEPLTSMGMLLVTNALPHAVQDERDVLISCHSNA